jgi:hypothetical protein
MWLAAGVFWNIMTVSASVLLLLAFFVGSYHHQPVTSKG